MDLRYLGYKIIGLVVVGFVFKFAVGGAPTKLARNPSTSFNYIQDKSLRTSYGSRILSKKDNMNELHQSNFLPKTSLGKWSVGLNIFFLIGIGVSVLLVNGLGLLSYDDRWWDITVPIVFSATIIAFIVGIGAIRKHKEFSVLVYASVGIGLLSILFIFLHSLFISD